MLWEILEEDPVEILLSSSQAEPSFHLAWTEPSSLQVVREPYQNRFPVRKRQPQPQDGYVGA